MTTKSKTALVAALVLGSASTASAVDVTAGGDKDRGLATYQQTTSAPQPRGQLIERRNVVIEGRNVGVGFEPFVPAEQKHWYDRNSIDFNS